MASSTDWRSQPERPAIVPAFAMGFVLWGACAIAYGSLRTFDLDVIVELVAASAVGVFVSVAIMVRVSRCRIVTLCVVAGFVGLLAAGIGAYAMKAESRALEYVDWSHARVQLVEDSRLSARGEQAIVEFEGIGCNARALATFRDPGPFLRGERYEVSASVSVERDEPDEYLWSKGAIARLDVVRNELIDEPSPFSALLSARKRAIAAFGGGSPEAGLLAAIVCGYRHDIEDLPEYDAFQTCGLAHLVAVSGAHLSIVAGLSMQLLRFLRVRRTIAVATAIAMLCAYLVFSGMPPSAVRATVMSSIAMLSFFGKRRSSSMNALGVGMCLMVATSPQVSVSASFALSCLSTAGIILLCPLIDYKLDSVFKGRFALATGSLSLTVAASLMSQLYATSLFGLLPLVSPIANIVCAPLFAPLCSAGLLAALAALVPNPASAFMMNMACGLASLLEAVVSFLSRMPYASIPYDIDTPSAIAVSLILGAGVWMVWARISIRKALCTAAFATTVIASAAMAAGLEDEIVVLDVGQGDAILVRSRGQSMLVDTGNQDAKLIAALGRNCVYHVGSVLVTHADDDHYGSLDAVGRAVHVERGIVHSDMLACSDEACRDVISQLDGVADELVGVEAGDVFEVGAFTCTVIWPRAYVDDGGNADSLCLAVSYDGDDDGRADARALFTGDAEKEQLEAMLSAGSVGQVDILKVGHHGSKNAMTDSEAAALGPSIALIGVGEGNRYGHPHVDTLELLDGCGAAVFRTDEDGDIRCTLSPDGIRVRTMK